MTYFGVVHKDPKSSYGISFPELPGCTACSDSLDGVIERGQEALELYLEYEQTPPEPSGLEYVLDHSEKRNRLVVYPFQVPAMAK